VRFLGDFADSQPQAMQRLRALRKLPIEDGGPGLIDLLGHSSHEVRSDAARALGKARWEPAVPRLLECLDDPHPHVVSWCADALGRIGDRDAIPGLAAVLQRADDTPRIYAAQALGRISHRAAVPALIGALEDPSRAVFKEARAALEALVQPEDRKPLKQIASRIGRSRRRKLKAVFEKLAERGGAAA
jgi:HEAT repeat protein